MSEPHTKDQQSKNDEVVYVIGTPGSNIVKIGRSVNPAKRLADIATMSPMPLAILWTHPGGYELETRLHRHFREFRSHGEWFNFTDEPLPAIQSAVAEEPWNEYTAGSRRAREARRAAQRGMADHLGPIFDEALTEVRAIEDPVERFKVARACRTVITESERSLMVIQKEVIWELREQNFSWREIGERLDMSGARAEQIARDRKFR